MVILEDIVDQAIAGKMKIRKDRRKEMDISNKASDADYIREVEKTINDIQMSVTETLDEFIFQTIDEFIRSNFYTVVSKEELVQAIRLIQMIRQHGQDITEKLVTAEENSAIFRRGYSEGYRAGIEKEHALLEKARMEETNYVL